MYSHLPWPEWAILRQVRRDLDRFTVMEEELLELDHLWAVRSLNRQTLLEIEEFIICLETRNRVFALAKKFNETRRSE